MKKVVCVFLAAIMLLSLAACGKQPTSSSAPAEVGSANEPVSAEQPKNDDAGSGEKKVLRIAASSWQVTKIFLEEAAAAFEEAHDDVDVEVITMADNDVLATYSTDWSFGTTDVDLVLLDGITWANQMSSQDLIYDFENDLHFFDNYDKTLLKEGVLDYGRIDGKLVLFPIIYEVYGICVNADMFREAGLVDANGNPLQMKTWDEFYEFAKKLTIYDDKGVVSQQGAALPFSATVMPALTGALVAQNGTLFKDDGITIDYDNEGLVSVLANWQKGVKDGVYSAESITDNLAPRNNYKAGKVAMIYEAAGRWMEAADLLGGEDKVSVLNIPGGKGTYGFTNGVIMPKCTPNADIAVQFIQEQLLGEFVQTNTFSQYGKMAVVDEYYKAGVEAHPLWGNLDESMSNALANPAYQDAAKLEDGLANILANGMQDDSISAEDMVKSMQELVDSIEK